MVTGSNPRSGTQQDMSALQHHTGADMQYRLGSTVSYTETPATRSTGIGGWQFQVS